jgi:DNA-binding CsgD family transcriptional regulator/PAS domain-containing protein
MLAAEADRRSGLQMSLDERIHRAIQALYDAAVDEALWPQTLAELTGFTDSQGATFWMLKSDGQLPTFTYVDFDPKFAHEYLSNMARHDPTVQYLVSHPHQKIVHDGLVISERDKDRHFYYEWQRRWSDIRYRLVGQVIAGDGEQAGIALHRAASMGGYDSAEVDRFTFVHRHLERAMTIAFRLASLGAMQQCTGELLDRHPAAIFLLDKQRRVVYANRRAEELRSGADGIRWSAAGITLLRKQDHDHFQQLVGQALARVADTCSAPGGAMKAPRPSGKRSYAILIAPASPRFQVLSLPRPEICVMITDPEGGQLLPANQLQSAFGLTPAEARLAALLANGEELRTAAAKLSITYGTARVRLANLFEKTDTRRQGELVRLLLTAIAPV